MKIFIFTLTLIILCLQGSAKGSRNNNGYTKVAVALGDLGRSPGEIHDIEVIDLSSSNTRCQNLQNFPFKNSGVLGGLGFGENPIICGGKIKQSSCHSFQDGSWKPDASLKKGRYGSAMTRSPFPNDGSKLFVTGGWDESFNRLKSSEVLTENGWKFSTPLPFEILSHCMVMINSTSVMVIGGEQHKSEEISGKTFLLDGVENIWREGPQLKKARAGHNCAMIRKDSQSQDKHIIVVGGYDNDKTHTSTEVFDVSSSEWKRGPELPVGIYGAAMVEDPSGGVVLIGGVDEDKNLDTLFRLSDAGSGATWEEMPQKLKTARWALTAFLIPDKLANCK